MTDHVDAHGDDHGHHETPPSPPPEQTPEAPAAEEQGTVQVVEEMPPEKKRGRREVDLKTFKVGDVVFYFQNGAWRSGRLDAPPEKKRGVIRIKISGSEMRLETAPYRVEFPLATGLQLGDKEYTVRRVYPGVNGEPLYDLNTDDPADDKLGITEEILKEWKSAGEKKEAVRHQAEKAKEVAHEAAEHVLEKMKEVKGKVATELIKALNTLEQKAHEVEVLFEGAGDDEAELKKAAKNIRELRRTVEKEIADLEKRVDTILKEERAVEEGKEKQKLGQMATKLFERKAEKMDEPAVKEYQTKVRQWEKTVTAYNDWKAEVDELEKKVGKEKDKDTDEAVKLRDLKSHGPDKPSRKPILEKPSEAERKKLFDEVFQDLLAAGADNAEIAKIIQEVEVRRHAAAKEVGREDFASETEEEGKDFRAENIKQFEKIVSEWSAIPEKLEPIDFAAERQELIKKASELEEKAHEFEEDELREKIQEIVAGGHGRPSVKEAASGRELIELWHALGTVEIELAHVKKEEKEETEHEEAEGVMDLPQDVVKEMLLANPEGVKAAMEEAYAVLYTPERTKTKLEGVLRDFFRNIDIDAGPYRGVSLRQRLAKAGVKDWETFAKKFEGPMAEKLADVLLQAAEAELRTFLAQKIGDIKKLSGDKRTWGEFVKDTVGDYSALSKMKGAIGLRVLTNTLVVGGAGVAAGIGANLLPFLPGGAKAAAVGGVVGFVKGITQRFLGRDQGHLQKEAARAKASAEADKKKMIADTLVKRTFQVEADGTTTLRDANELGHLFARSIRRATEGETHALEFKDAEGKFLLTGDAVCMYHEALKRAAETEGLEIEQKTKLEFARALHALHNNRAIVPAEAPPYLAQKLQWLTEAYSGRRAVPGGKEGETEQSPKGFRQLGITTALGAGVAWAATMDGAYVRMGIGATYGILRGQKAQFESDRRTADRESRENLEVVVTEVSDLLAKADQATPMDLALVKDYRDVIAGLLGRKKIELAEGSAVSMLDKGDSRHIRWLMAHSEDTAHFLDREERMRRVLESVQREISRSGFLERQNTELRTSFNDALASMKNANERLKDAAKNKLSVRVGRVLKGGARSLVYGAAGAGVSWAIGKGVAALRKEFFGAPATPAAGPEGARHEVGVAAAPAEHHEGAVVAAPAPEAHPAPAEHPVEFPAGSEVHKGEGITDPVSRQLFDKFKADSAHGDKPSVTLQDGHTYTFRGDIHSDKALHDFAVRRSADMAKLAGDINLKAGTEKWLEFMGEGKGHVVLVEHDGKFGYEIQGEETKLHGIEYGQAEHPAAPSEATGKIPEEEGWVPLHHEAPVLSDIHLTGDRPLAEQLQAPFSEEQLRQITGAKPEIDLFPHTISGGGARAAAQAGIDETMAQMHEQIAEQTAFHDWAMGDPNVQRYVAAGILNEDQLETLIKEWSKTHPTEALGSSHSDFLSAVKYKALETPATPGASAKVEAAVMPEVKAAGQLPMEEGKPAGPIPTAETGVEVVATSVDHPVAIEVHGNEHIVHFFDQADHKDHTAIISETLSPQASGDEHNPLSIKLTASGRPVLARLEMHSIPGKLDKEPVIVFEDKTFNEEILYRIVDGQLEKIETESAS